MECQAQPQKRVRKDLIALDTVVKKPRTLREVNTMFAWESITCRFAGERKIHSPTKGFSSVAQRRTLKLRNHSATFLRPPQHPALATRSLDFFRSCLVGSSGTVVDMGMLFLFTDPRWLGLDLALSKIAAAELALINNFVWNESWTFGRTQPGGSILGRFLKFNGFCGGGIILATITIYLLRLQGISLFAANVLAIISATFWNYLLNSKFTWHHSEGAKRISNL